VCYYGLALVGFQGRGCPVVYLQRAGNSAAPKPGTMLSYHTIVRGRCHDTAPCLLPTRDPGTLVALCHAALHLAKRMCSVPSEASRTCAHHLQAQTFQGAQTFTGLTQTPPCAACEHAANSPQVPPPKQPAPMPPTNRRPRAIDTSMHFCPHAGCAYQGWLGLGNLRANGHPSGGRWRQFYCRACQGSCYVNLQGKKKTLPLSDS
jgi:hypothetical protein